MWDRPQGLWCLQSPFSPVTWEGLSVPRSCLYRVDFVVGWDSTNIIHGTKIWIYCTFDTSQKLSQIWYWL